MLIEEITEKRPNNDNLPNVVAAVAAERPALLSFPRACTFAQVQRVTRHDAASATAELMPTPKQGCISLGFSQINLYSFRETIKIQNLSRVVSIFQGSRIQKKNYLYFLILL